MHTLDLTGSARNHGQFGVKTLEVELTHHTVMSLLDQEHSRTGLELFLDELEFPLGQAEPLRVFPKIGVRVWKEYLGGRLLDQGSADGTVEHVTRTLRRETHHAVELSPGLRAVVRETLESRVSQQPPELIHPTHEAPAIEKLAHQVKQIQGDRRPRQRVVDKIRDVESDDRSTGQSRHHGIPGVIEYPRVVPATHVAPACKSRVQAFRIRRIQKFHEAGQAPRLRVQSESTPQRLIEIGRFSRGV